MSRRKLPPGSKLIHVGVSMDPATWEQMQFVAATRSRAAGVPVSASAILREAVAEYLARRFGPTAPATVSEPEQMAV